MMKEILTQDWRGTPKAFCEAMQADSRNPGKPVAEKICVLKKKCESLQFLILFCYLILWKNL